MHKMKLLASVLFLTSVLLVQSQGSPIVEFDTEVIDYEDESYYYTDDYSDEPGEDGHGTDGDEGAPGLQGAPPRNPTALGNGSPLDRRASSMGGSSTGDSPWWRFNDDTSEDEGATSSRLSILPQIRDTFRSASEQLQHSVRRIFDNGRQVQQTLNNGLSNLYTHKRVDMYERRPRRHQLWLPGNRDSDEWRRCHGMSSNDYERTKRRIRQILRFAQQDSDSDLLKTSSTSGGSRRVTDNSITLPEGTLDGCIWLTYEQADSIYRVMRDQRRGSRLGGRYKRKIIDLVQNPWSKWDVSKPIIYKFDQGKHDESQKQIIRNALAHWEQNSCIRFQEVTIEQVIEENHLVFTKSGRCQSYVGRVSINPQPISLDDACLYEFGVPVHEIGHALGFWHEQQRVDRADHIDIAWENLGQYRSQYLTSNTVSHGLPYDLSSVMHYATYDGSTNANKVILTKDPLYQQTPGQRTGLSFLDTKLINTAYCSDTCYRIKLKRPCDNGGFQDPNSCHQCVCPDGVGGRYCEDVAPPVNAVCGGEVYATPTEKFITSPGYDTDYHYQPQQECSWLIKAPAGQKVSLEFVEDFGLYFHHAETCFHWVEVKYKEEFAKNGPRFCGYRETPDVILNSTTNEMLVIFKSNYSLQMNNYMRGFKARIVAINEDGSNPVAVTTPVPTTPTTPTTTTPATTQAPWSWRCSFDSETNNFYDWCSIEQERIRDEFDWTLKSGKTPSYNTGPTWAFDGRYYIYIEASSPRKYGDQATIRLPDFGRTGKHCLTFNFYMWGFHINQLDVFQQRPNSDVTQNGGNHDVTTIWTKTGQQTDMWLSGQVQLDLEHGDRIGFTGVRGMEFSGDIALDNIQITSGVC